ncbi:MAG: aldehyde dehydrogenase [Lachnospiraceae bacterium]|nr:aldehyde dehydrogenase [Lachnospiraceae bacterium]
MDMKQLVDKQRDFFQTQVTHSIAFRLKALERLEQGIKDMEQEIYAALKADLNKSSFEAYMTEVGMTLAELSFVKKRLKKWAMKQPVPTPLAQFPAVSFTVAEPYGVVLIMSPWNYPFMLCMEPLIGALAAGNCCILKPSAYSEAVSAVIVKLIKKVFPAKYVTVVEGGRKENTELLDQRFDYIFFTGGVTVGKLVMEKASRNLTPVSLELGGKSPCIIDETADIHMAAKRLVFGKFLNSGQTCVAPDYVLVQDTVEQELLLFVKYWIKKMFGDDPLQNPDYPKIINEKHFQRILGLLENEKIAAGGRSNTQTRQIEPTVLSDVSADAPVMQEEIFGPILPILKFHSLNDAKKIITSHEKPLALYMFTTDVKNQEWIMNNISYGGGCINDTIVHLATSRMGFGGVGGSGMGSYHGKLSFETFSHRKSIVKKANWLDLPIRYQPYNGVKEKLLHLFLR